MALLALHDAQEKGFATSFVVVSDDDLHFHKFDDVYVEGALIDAGGRINHTLKYGLEVAGGWKVVADNLQLRIEGDGVTHESVRAVIGRMAEQTFWDTPDVRRAVLAKLPGYRLSKFQNCLPERFAVEVIERYLLDVEGAVGWVGTTLGQKFESS